MTDHPHLDVLVVDDEYLIRWAVARTLATAGHRVQEAADAAEAIAQLQHQAADVALVDYHLPDTRGLELVRALRGLAPAMAIVMMTTDPGSELDETASLGVHQVLQKPFELNGVEPVLLDAYQARQIG